MKFFWLLLLVTGVSQAATPKKRLSIVYFSEVLGPGVANGDGYVPNPDAKGNPRPGFEGYNIWNQFSFRYKFDNGWEPFFNTRFTWTFGERNRLGSDDGPFRTEDQVTGVRKTLWASGAWSFFAQLGYRLPTSRSTIDAKWNGQVECFCILDWTPNKDWSLGAWIVPRFYVPSAESNTERWRFYVAPYVRRRLGEGEVWLQAFLEQEIQHNNVMGERAYNFAKRSLNAAYLGVEFNLNPKLILYPFVRSYNLAKPAWETTAVGTWIIWLAY